MESKYLDALRDLLCATEREIRKAIRKCEEELKLDPKNCCHCKCYYDLPKQVCCNCAIERKYNHG